MGKKLERLLVNLPGWVFVLAGMSILSMAVLVPAWTDSQALNYQHDLLKLQAKRWGEQETNYRQFAKALETNDPVVLQRLAVQQLRLKPTGTAPIDPMMTAGALAPRPGPQRPVPITTVKNNGRGVVYATTAMVNPPMPQGPAAPMVPTIESILRRPIPVAGVNYPAYRPLPSRVVRITTGPLRWAFLAAGFMLVVAGLIAKTRTDIVEETPAVEENATGTDATTTAAAAPEAVAEAASEPTGTPDATPTVALAPETTPAVPAEATHATAMHGPEATPMPQTLAAATTPASIAPPAPTEPA